MIWASPRFRRPHSEIPTDMGIPFSYYPGIRLRVRVTGHAHITRVLGMGMPKTRGCPYHCDTGSRIRHFRNQKGTGAEMRPAIVSWIVTGGRAGQLLAN